MLLFYVMNIVLFTFLRLPSYYFDYSSNGPILYKILYGTVLFYVTEKRFLRLPFLHLIILFFVLFHTFLVLIWAHTVFLLHSSPQNGP